MRILHFPAAIGYNVDEAYGFQSNGMAAGIAGSIVARRAGSLASAWPSCQAERRDDACSF